ncbi:MAG: helix-turn-helix domain-containing protein [Fuscovulum sp.]|nr:helix-turn-helix domain-containing protein [Fuscovulum sp.]
MKAKKAKDVPVTVPSAEEVSGDLQIGRRIRMVRESVGLSQRELARRSGITNATISLIEQDSHAPSVTSLHRILSAIPMSLADFFALPVYRKNVLFYRPDELTVVSRGAADLRVLAAERRDKTLQMFFEHYAPGAGIGPEKISHDGETAAIVIQGVIEITTADGVERIEAGGGYQVFGNQPYSLRNIGEDEAIVVCAVTPPMM